MSHQLKAFSFFYFIPHRLESTREILWKLILPKLKMPAWEKYQLMCLFSCIEGCSYYVFKEVRKLGAVTDATGIFQKERARSSADVLAIRLPVTVQC